MSPLLQPRKPDRLPAGSLQKELHLPSQGKRFSGPADRCVDQLTRQDRSIRGGQYQLDMIKFRPLALVNGQKVGGLDMGQLARRKDFDSRSEEHMGFQLAAG